MLGETAPLMGPLVPRAGHNQWAKSQQDTSGQREKKKSTPNMVLKRILLISLN